MNQEFLIEINGKSFSVKLEQQHNDSLSFLVNGNLFHAKITPENKISEQSAAPILLTKQISNSQSSDGSIFSPLPGIVSRIFVAVGQQVNLGDTLFVLEAMKMENPVKAMGSGVVQEILVKEGTQVKAGQVVVKILP